MQRILMLLIGSLFVLVIAVLASALLTYLKTQTNSPSNTAHLGSGEMFDSIADYYDSLNSIMSLNLHLGWKHELVGSLALQGNDQILDIATGTGDVALIIAESLRSRRTTGNVILAVDPSKNMLSHAEVKSRAKNLTEFVRFELGNAMNLVNIPNGSYTKISMSFGIRNVPDRLEALKEFYRIISKSDATSRLGIMEFVSPKEGLLSPLANFFISYIIPVLGSAFSSGHSSEYKHLSDSIMTFPPAAQFAMLIESAGFTSCEVKNVFFHVVVIFLCRV
jgi:demethylmenaquinone methyltransferase/2-methoxy-6-polyprenyl-1,4-benzoquinol methylase